MNRRIVTDIFLLAFVALCVFKAHRDGFFASAVNLCGKFAALGAASYASSQLPGRIFDAVRPRIAEKVSEYLSRLPESRAIETVLEDCGLGFLNTLAQSAPKLPVSGSSLLSPGRDSVDFLVDSFIRPVFSGFAAAVIFVLCFIAVNIACSLLAFALKAVNDLPLLGGANRFLGLFVGVAEGCLNIILLSFLLCIIVAVTGRPERLTRAVEGSRILALTGFINPFLP